MSRIYLDQDIKPLSDFRANAATAIRHIQQTKRALVLTRRGYSAAVVLDVSKYEELMEELETLRDQVQQSEKNHSGPHMVKAVGM